MTFTMLPWSALSVLLLILFLLFLRELFILIRIPLGHPERKPTYFNSFVLLSFFCAALYGTHMLMLHEAAFATLFPRYPSARYAPEREIFGEWGDWVYVTRDTPVEVLSFYKQNASSSQYGVIGEDAPESNKLMLVGSTRTLFLTVLHDRELSVLYFSSKGRMEEYPSPTH